MRRLLLAAWVLLLGGCATTPWGAGVNLGEAIDGEATPNGLVVVLGPETWATAAARVTAELDDAFPTGIALDAGIVLDGAKLGLGEIHVTWPALVIPQLVTLGAAPSGVNVACAVEMPLTKVRVAVGDAVLCELTMTLDGALVSQLGLGKDKYGAIRTNVLKSSAFVVDAQQTQVQQCLFALGPDHTDMLLDVVLDRIRTDLTAALAPFVESEVPEALGLNLATAFATTVTHDPMGVGRALWRVQSAEGNTTALWNDASDQIVVPFSVTLDVQRHPCVPAYPLPRVVGKAVPTLTGDVTPALWVNAPLAARAFHVAWQTGAICGGRPTGKLAVASDTLRPIWPGLAKLPDDTPIALRIWPKGVPEVAFSAKEGQAWVTIASGPVRVELVGALHGTWLELAVMEVAVTVEGGLEVDPNMGLILTPDRIDVSTHTVAPGLLDAPGDDVPQALLEPMVRELLEAPLMSLPPLALADPTLDVGLQDGYLLFHVSRPTRSEAPRD